MLSIHVRPCVHVFTYPWVNSTVLLIAWYLSKQASLFTTGWILIGLIRTRANNPTQVTPYFKHSQIPTHLSRTEISVLSCVSLWPNKSAHGTFFLILLLYCFSTLNPPPILPYLHLFLQSFVLSPPSFLQRRLTWWSLSTPAIFSRAQ